MKNIKKHISKSFTRLTLVVLILLGTYQNSKSQGMVLTQCAIDLVSGLDSLVSGLYSPTICAAVNGTSFPYPLPFTNVLSQRTVLNAGCAMTTCSSVTNTRFVFSSINGGYNDHIDLSWPIATTNFTANFGGQRSICNPADVYSINATSTPTNSNAFPSCGSALQNFVDKLRIKQIVGSSYQDLNVYLIKSIKNPRLMTPLNVGFWTLSSTVSTFTHVNSPAGLLVDVTLKNDETLTCMLWHEYSPDFGSSYMMVWKQNIVCPSISGYSISTTNVPFGCTQSQFSLNTSATSTSNCSNILWDHGDGGPLDISTCATVSPIVNSYTYVSPGTFTPSAYMVGPGSCYSKLTTTLAVTCIPPCVDCIPSFAPLPGGTYVVSGWVKEATPSQSITSYVKPRITVAFTPTTLTSITFTTTGGIIDGWQRIEGQFTISPTATDLDIKLECTSGDCYFDDVRVFPVDGSMKSYVYDPVTMRLVAELDERNYATLYEYDEEGKLIRVKKETEKGKMTIQENRNNTKKKN